jgi:hypothetical protein
VILLPAILAGLLTGWLASKWHGSTWHLPELQHTWLVVIFFLPQFFAFYLPSTRNHLSILAAAACLVTSQIGLLLFCLVNPRLPGMPLLTAGVFFNLLAVITNNGLMPLSTVTAAQLVPDSLLANMPVGARFSPGSKDILLLPEMINLPWLSDRFVSPTWMPYRFAYSLGDILISTGVFLLLVLQNSQRKVQKNVNQPVI